MSSMQPLAADVERRPLLAQAPSRQNPDLAVDRLTAIDQQLDRLEVMATRITKLTERKTAGKISAKETAELRQLQGVFDADVARMAKPDSAFSKAVQAIKGTVNGSATANTVDDMVKSVFSAAPGDLKEADYARVMGALKDKNTLGVALTVALAHQGAFPNNGDALTGFVDTKMFDKRCEIAKIIIAKSQTHSHEFRFLRSAASALAVAATTVAAGALAVSSLTASVGTKSNCPPAGFDSMKNFEVDKYLGKWYVQEQAVTNYLPKEQNYCVSANYTKTSDTTIDVDNFSRVGSVTGRIQATEPHLKATITDPSDPSKLKVGPQWLPSFLGGPYWVIETGPLTSEGAYSWAIVSGGVPKQESNGACIADSKALFNFNGNGQGLWILTRDQIADPEVVQDVRTRMQRDYGLDVSALNPVQPEGC